MFQANQQRVIQIGQGRSVLYALREPLSRVRSPIPVWRVAPGGTVSSFGQLEPLSRGRFLFNDTLYDDLPWFIWDIRPQGFIGRAFARAAAGLSLPQDLLGWSNEDVLVALTQRGEDCPGDLIVGSDALARYMDLRMAPQAVSRADYPRLALSALQGGVAGSSAGGEQPKFATARGPDGPHVIVKFSPLFRESAAARRWADLLICEHLALTVMSGHGEMTARHELIEMGGRIMLETERFDRTPAGRRAVVSGHALDLEMARVGSDWIKLAARLRQDKRISPLDAETISLWHIFGLLIGNSDMHLGNLSFLTEDYRTFSLAPAYDMLPMRFAPAGAGEIVERDWALDFTRLIHPRFPAAADMAEDFWRRVQDCELIGGRFGKIAEDGLAELGKAREKMALLSP